MKLSLKPSLKSTLQTAPQNTPKHSQLSPLVDSVMLASVAAASSWIRLKICSKADLNCHVCLGDGGQAFTWENLDENTWMNVVDSFPVIIQSASDDLVYLYCLDHAALPAVRSYLRLDEDLEELCREWRSADAKFPTHLTGIRLLRQDPLETLFAFICSQNNVIQRIRAMVRQLKIRYGQQVATVASPFSEEILEFYEFPKDAGVFADAEDSLRQLKFGYRAKYIAAAARHLQSEQLNTSSALKSLRLLPYDEAIAKLTSVPGVGPKVADCVALMSCDQLSAVPIDTHIWRIARERYKFTLPGAATKTITPRAYQAIGDKFRTLFGANAGWAHSLLFTAELVKTKKSLK